MKRLILLFIFFLISCYREYEDFADHPDEFHGIWNNAATYVNNVRNYEIPRYSFMIMQDGITLYIDGERASSKYLTWRVDNIDSLLYIEDSPSNPNLIIKIIKWPSWGTMILGKDSITYDLSKNK